MTSKRDTKPLLKTTWSSPHRHLSHLIVLASFFHSYAFTQLSPISPGSPQLSLSLTPSTHLLISFYHLLRFIEMPITLTIMWFQFEIRYLTLASLQSTRSRGQAPGPSPHAQDPTQTCRHTAGHAVQRKEQKTTLTLQPSTYWTKCRISSIINGYRIKFLNNMNYWILYFLFSSSLWDWQRQFS